MSLATLQISEIQRQLSVDLSSVTNSRLIELCLLYRANPLLYPAFVNSLKLELNTRFTAAKLETEEVMFSVIQHFCNQFE